MIVRTIIGWRCRLSESQQAERIRAGAYLVVREWGLPQPTRKALRDPSRRAGGDVSRQAFDDE